MAKEKKQRKREFKKKLTKGGKEKLKILIKRLRATG